MDRREALKRLGVAGAVTLGASAVLSSQSVAYAASNCVTPPSTVTMRIRQPLSQRRLLYVRWEPTRPPTATSQSYAWGPATLTFSSVGGSLQLLSPTTRETRLRRLRPPLPNNQQIWVAGDQFSLEVQVTWSCAGGSPPVVARYRLDETAQAPGAANRTVTANLIA